MRLILDTTRIITPAAMIELLKEAESSERKKDE